MKIAVTAQGNTLDAPTSPRFGRCPTYILVETETLAFEALDNPAMAAAGGAGIQAAQFIVEQGIEALLTTNVGPNAMDVLQAASIPVYLISGGTVRQVVEAYKAGQLKLAAGANVPDHSGTGGAQRQPAAPAASREQEITELRTKAADLRQQLADVFVRIEKLAEEN